MSVEGDGIIEIVDAETVFREARNIRAEQPAAGGNHQAMIGEGLSFASGVMTPTERALGVDVLDAALYVDDIDRVEHLLQRRCQGLGLRLVKPRADHQRRLRRHQRDLEFFRRHAFDVAQAGGGKCGIHTGETGSDNNESHALKLRGFGRFKGRASPLPLLMSGEAVDDR